MGLHKRVLVTGSAGFVGSHFVEHILANTNWEIIGLDSFRHRGDSLRVVNDTRYKIFTHDLSTPLSSRLINKIGKLDYIVNMASESHVDRSIEDPVPFVTNNTLISLYMLEYTRIAKPEKFIQVSTDEVYGAAFGEHKHKEWEMILPSNPYAASKACQEAIAISYWRTYGIPLIITNTMNMVGERQDKEKFLPMLISKITKGETVTIHGNWKYIGRRHYLHARNFADALLHLLMVHKPVMYEDSEELILPSRYNVVGEVELNNLEVAQMVAEILNKPLKYELIDFHAARPGHDRRYALNGEKIKKMGWKQPKTFYESLKKTIEWTLAHPEWL
jgi:dTDP-glucose 4,6-dehydratase